MTLIDLNQSAPATIAPPFPAVPQPRLAPGSGRLVIIRGPDTGTEIPLATPVTTIGRHAGNHISLGDTTVSRQHAEIRVEGDRFLLADSGSLNGTYLNRHPVDHAELHDGDEIWIGRHRLLFQR